MRQFGLISALLLFSLSSFACSEEIRIQNVESGSYQYWCLVSRGTWSENTGSCICDDTPCPLGAVCIDDDGKSICSAPIATSPENPPTKPENEN